MIQKFGGIYKIIFLLATDKDSTNKYDLKHIEEVKSDNLSNNAPTERFPQKSWFNKSSDFDYLCVLDFEAQCSNDEKLEVQVFFNPILYS